MIISDDFLLRKIKIAWLSGDYWISNSFVTRKLRKYVIKSSWKLNGFYEIALEYSIYFRVNTLCDPTSFIN